MKKFKSGIALMDYNGVVNAIQEDTSKENILKWIKRLNNCDLVLVDNMETIGVGDSREWYNNLKAGQQLWLEGLYKAGNEDIRMS